MTSRRAFCFFLPILAGACAAPAPPTPAAPPADPVPARPATLSGRVRQAPWLTRFWAELSPSQRRRVRAALRRARPQGPAAEAEAARLWDGLGLPERDALVSGGRLPAGPTGTPPAGSPSGSPAPGPAPQGPGGTPPA